MLHQIRFFYTRARRPVAFVLVVALGVAAAIGQSGVAISAGLALLAILVEALFEVHAALGLPASNWSDSFNAATEEMGAEIERRLESRGSVRVRWLGVTMEAGWPVLQRQLLEAIKRSDRLNVAIAVYSPTPADVTWPSGPDQTDRVRESSRATVSGIRQFLSQHGSGMASSRSTLRVYEYGHRPTWHGLLIDDDLLCFSLAEPPNLGLPGPQGGAEKIKAAPGAPGARIHHFRAWFDEIASLPPVVDFPGNSGS